MPNGRLTLRAPGPWTRLSPDQVERFMVSAAECFPVLGADEDLAILVFRTPTPDHPPMAVYGLTPARECTILINVFDNYPGQLVYQFAHEYCHTFVDRTRAARTPDRCSWIEESLCETASLFAANRLREVWPNSPDPLLSANALVLEKYVKEDMPARPGYTLPPDVSFSTWLASQIDELEQDPTTDSGRAKCGIIATELLPIFETNAGGWRALRHLHDVPRTAETRAAEHLRAWAGSSSGAERSVVAAVARTLGLSI